MPKYNRIPIVPYDAIMRTKLRAVMARRGLAITDEEMEGFEYKVMNRKMTSSGRLSEDYQHSVPGHRGWFRSFVALIAHLRPSPSRSDTTSVTLDEDEPRSESESAYDSSFIDDGDGDVAVDEDVIRRLLEKRDSLLCDVKTVEAHINAVQDARKRAERVLGASS